MFNEVVLGVIQGFTEWLPISSEGVITMVSTSFLNNPFLSSIRLSLFLHLGTMFATIFFYREDFIKILKKPRSELGKFLFVASLFSGVTGLIGYVFLSFVSETLGRYSTLLIAVSLLVTAYLQKKMDIRKHAGEAGAKTKHGAIVGALQGLAIIPGISRSGITTSSLLLFNYDAQTALKLSFMMSIPAVLMGNIFLNIGRFTLSPSLIAGAISAFLVGLLSIKVFTQLVSKIRFWKICIILALLNLIAVVI